MAMENRRPDNIATQRVAVLHFGGPELAELTCEPGLEIAYVHDGIAGTEYLDFDGMPAFDLLASSLPSDVEAQEGAMGLTLWFISERKPVSFLLVGQDLRSNQVLPFLNTEARTLGYKMNMASENGGPTYLVGTQPQADFVWPPGVVPRTEPVKAPGGNP